MRIKSLISGVVLSLAGMVLLFLVVSLFFGGPAISDHTDSLGDGYTYFSANSLDKTIMHSGQSVIGNLVIDYQSDDNFIVALRLKAISYECARRQTAFYRYTNDLEYWLIDKSKNKQFVTKDAVEFARLRNENIVPESLKVNLKEKEYFLKKIDKLNEHGQIHDDDCIVDEP